ncbi:MAG: hypothetical protein IJ599_05350 [Alphaproteobacteria bacterium]|nr:hypothetical protein [Alphaproteobacteria bacterium]
MFEKPMCSEAGACADVYERMHLNNIGRQQSYELFGTSLLNVNVSVVITGGVLKISLEPEGIYDLLGNRRYGL